MFYKHNEKHVLCELYTHSKEATVYQPMRCIAMQLSLQLWVFRVAHRGRKLTKVSYGKFSRNFYEKCPLMKGQRDAYQVKPIWNSSNMCVMQFYCFEDYASNTFAHCSFYIALWFPQPRSPSLNSMRRRWGGRWEFCDAPSTKKVFIKDFF